MSQTEKFWHEIALLLEQDSLNGPPGDWNRFKIESFLIRFKEKLSLICRQDPSKAKLCRVSATRNGDIQEPGLSYHSFRRIFITRESQGNRTTRELFAIYLGFDSYEDFLAQKGLTTDPQPDDAASNVVAPPASKSFRVFPWTTSIGLIILAAVLLAWGSKGWIASFQSNPPKVESRYLIIRNEYGIPFLNLERASRSQSVSEAPLSKWMEYDPAARMFYCANAYAGSL